MSGKAPKDPVGTTMRLVYKTILTEIDFQNTRAQQTMRRMFALQKQIDTRLVQYFDEHPEQKTPTKADFNRFGLFMRKVQHWREQNKACRQSNSPDNRIKVTTSRLEVETDVKRYFGQFPDQSPDQDILQLKFTNDLHNLEYLESLTLFK
jgi:hypothetical protein